MTEQSGGARALNILITAGGTSEKIDDVRRITNSGTGRLGACIAEAFAANKEAGRIVYICSANAVRPHISDVQFQNVSNDADAGERTAIEVRVADDVNAVREAVKEACAEIPFDIIIHSMAIGDYVVRDVSDATLMTQGLVERLSTLICGDSSSPEEAISDVLLNPPAIKEAKISSDKENLIVVLEKAPKIIALFRGLAPNATIIGFKLLSGVSEEELVRVGCELLEKNDCDFVLANDMHTVRTNSHEGLLITKNGTYAKASGKSDIASLIVRSALEHDRNKQKDLTE